MEIKKVKNRIISVLLLVVIFAVNFNFLPIQSLMNQSIFTGTVVAYAATTKPGNWIKSSDGKWRYKHTDGTYTKNGWEYINGYWYHFDANGYMQTGWQKINNEWYHFDSEGHRQTGWVKIGNYWYHFDSNGIRQTGWQKINNEWYYFNSDGIRQVGWQQVDGKWYHLDSNGIMETGWKKINEQWYYFNSDGVRQTGWQKINNQWYHFDSNGIRQTGWQKIGNYWYHFDSDGIRQTGWQKLNGDWYYFNSDGIRQVGWQQVDGKWYHLDSNGIMEIGWVKIGTDWYFFHSTGERYVGWLIENGKTYHFDSNGIMDTGWKTINSNKYYFNSDGSMQVGWKKIGGSWYYFNPNGGIMNTKTFKEGSREYKFFDSGALKSTVLNIPVQPTEGLDWCWAACARSVGIYDISFNVSQKEIYDYITEKYGSFKLRMLPEAIVYASNNTKKADLKENFDFQTIVNEIDNNRPVVLVLQYKNNAVHSSVCAGYDLETKQLTLVTTDSGIAITKSKFENSSKSFYYFGDEVTCPYIAYTY